MRNSLENLFNTLQPKASSSDSRPQTEGLVSNIQIDNSGKAVITLLSQNFPKPNELIQTEIIFEKILNVEEMFFAVESPDLNIVDLAEYLFWAARHIEKKDPFAGALVRGAQAVKAGDTAYSLFFNDTGDCKYFDQICKELEQIYFTTFGIAISFIAEMCKVDLAKEAEEIYRLALDEASKYGANIPDSSAGKSRRNDNFSKQSSGYPTNAFKNQNASRSEYKGKKVIWGKMSAAINPVHMSELNNETGFTVFQGRIFAIDQRTVSNGSKILVKFNISDGTNSIKCFVFMNPDKAVDFVENQSKKYLRIYASVGFDSQFEKDLVAKVIGIEECKSPDELCDDSGKKRIELHSHTKMSSKDSVCDIKYLVERAVHFGHEALAITDHGVVHAFPDAFNAQSELKKKGKSIKIIYGMECYLADDGTCAAYMCDDVFPESGFIAIAVSSDGTAHKSSRVTGFSAIRFIKNEKDKYAPVDKLDWKYTGESGLGFNPVIFEAISGLSRFIGDSYIVADNVINTVSFLRYEGYRTKSERDPKVKFYTGAIDSQVLNGLYTSDKNLIESQVSLSIIELFPENKEKLNDIALHSGWVLSNAVSTQVTESINELNYSAGKRKPSEFLSNSEKNFHCVLLAGDEIGLYGLYRLVSESHIKFIYRDRPRVPRSMLDFFGTGLIKGSACEAGEVFSDVISLYDKNECNYTNALSELATSDVIKTAQYYDYLEIQPIGNNEFMLRAGERKGLPVPPKYKSKNDLINLNLLVADISSITGIPVCATGDVHFIEKNDSTMRKILQYDSGYSDALQQAPLFLHTTQEMLDEFSYFDKNFAEKIVIENPALIASLVKPDMRPFPDGSFPPNLDIAESEVNNLTWGTARNLYEMDGVMPEIVSDRVKKELKAIIGNGFSIMFYIALHLVKKSNEDGYIVGSRGSVGSSLVARLCGITEVNPLAPHYLCSDCRYSEFIDSLEYNSGYDLPDKNCPHCGTSLDKEGQDIPFETFMGFDGDKQPDIDLNFSGEYQARAHKFIEDMFGKNHTFRAGTISGYADKNAAMMVRKYCEGNGLYMTGAEASRIAVGIEGVKRTTSQHPGGIVVIPKDREIYDFTPVQCPADKVDGGIITTHFDFNSLHNTILKLDILGHDDPTMLKVLGDMTGVDVSSIPITDNKIMHLLKGGEELEFITYPGHNCGTLGLPELGTFMARAMVEETHPSKFHDLVQLMGLSHGTDVWSGNARELIKDGICNISEVIGCRDGIMTALEHKGLSSKLAFAITESVRRGKGLSPDQEKAMRDNNVPDWYIESCKKIKYMFPKAHAVAYTISTLRIAWFKIYRKTEYYCAYFSIRADDFDYRFMYGNADSVLHYMNLFLPAFKTKEKLVIKILKTEEEFSIDKAKKIYYILELVNEMYCRGISFLPIDIYKSDSTRFIMESETEIRPPLNTLPSLSETIAGNIVNARIKNIRFVSREDFAQKAGIGDTIIEMLEQHGCFNSIPRATQIDMFSSFNS